MVQAVSGSSDEIVFTVSANESTSSREATITVTSEDGNLVRQDVSAVVAGLTWWH